MPLVPVVAIEIPAEVPPDLATVLLRSCNLALGAGRCAAAGSTEGPNQELAWVASFALDPAEPSQLRVDLRNSIPQQTQTRLTRTLAFEGNEGPTHRWSTAGVVVAALVVSAESTTRNRPPPDENASNLAPSRPDVATTQKPKASSAPLPPAVPAPRSGRAVRIDLGGLFGTGVEETAMRYGGRLRPSVELSRLAFLWSEFALSKANRTVETWVWSGAAGLGFVTRSAEDTLAVEGRLGGRGDRLEFKATKDQLTAEDSRLRGGVVAGVDFTLSVSRPLAIWLGGEGALLFPRIDVNVGSSRVGQLGLVDGQLSLGLRYRLDFDSQ